MTQTLKSIIATLLLAFSLLVPVLAYSAVPVSADIEDRGTGIQGGLDAGARSVDEDGADDPAGETVQNMITTVINVFSLVVGVISVIMIIIGGLKYIMSGGDSGNVTAAKNTILYAIIGLVIVALAQIIVRFVLQTVAGD